MQPNINKELCFANKELQWDFGKDYFKADKIIDYFIFIGENDEGYQRFLKMLARVKTSTLYRNQTTHTQMTRYLKTIEHELSTIQITETNGNHIHLLSVFVNLIFQCNFIYTNYVKYVPLCEDFEKL